jgi:opacity protein-like surface antigen
MLGAAASVAVLSTAWSATAQTANQDNVWNGFYVGANLGAAWGNTSLRASATPGAGARVIPQRDIVNIAGVPTNSSTTGFTIGAEGGYNYQTGHLLIGVETDGGYLDIRQSRTATFGSAQVINPPVNFAISEKVKTDWQWTLRPRIGYAWGPWLAYLTGGVGVTDTRLSASYADTRSPPNAAGFSVSSTRAGGVVGVGGAWMFAPGWSGKIEWLYSDYGHVSGSVPVGNGFAVFTSSANVRANTVRAGIDYKFGP